MRVNGHKLDISSAVVKAGDETLIDTEPEGAEAAREILARYAPFSRVRLDDLSGSWSVLGVYGPRADEDEPRSGAPG